MKNRLGKTGRRIGGAVLLLVFVAAGYFLLRPKPPLPPEYESHVISVDTGQTDAPFQGLGWHVYQPEARMYIAHGGGGPGFGSDMRLYPEESLGLIVLANDTTYDRGAILDLFASLDW